MWHMSSRTVWQPCELLYTCYLLAYLLILRCEVRPGPEYVLRQYRFYDGRLFDLRLFHYSDADCRSPSYSLTARGTYRPYQTSWIVDGGTTQSDCRAEHRRPTSVAQVTTYKYQLSLIDPRDGIVL